MKITDIKCAVIASSPAVRITTDEGITGWSQIETPKPYLQPIVLQLTSWVGRAGSDQSNEIACVERSDSTKISHRSKRLKRPRGSPLRTLD